MVSGFYGPCAVLFFGAWRCPRSSIIKVLIVHILPGSLLGSVVSDLPVPHYLGRRWICE